MIARAKPGREHLAIPPTTGSRTVSSKITTPSLRPVAKPGTSSSISPKQSCPSDRESGLTKVDNSRRWYKPRSWLDRRPLSATSRLVRLLLSPTTTTGRITSLYGLIRPWLADRSCISYAPIYPFQIPFNRLPKHPGDQSIILLGDGSDALKLRLTDGAESRSSPADPPSTAPRSGSRQDIRRNGQSPSLPVSAKTI